MLLQARYHVHRRSSASVQYLCLVKVSHSPSRYFQHHYAMFHVLRGTVLFSGTAFAAFVGLGSSAYKPYCCTSCRAAFRSATLTCTPHHHGGGHSHGPMTSPECFASDEPFLSSLAYCLNSTCTGKDEIPRVGVGKVVGDTSKRRPNHPSQHVIRRCATIGGRGAAAGTQRQ